MLAPIEDHVVDILASLCIFVPRGHVAERHEPRGKEGGLQAGAVGGTITFDVLHVDASQIPECEGQLCSYHRCCSATFSITE